jgi:hypothetical protein
MIKSSLEPHVLDRECNVLSEYLTGRNPSDYVLNKYREASARSNLFPDSGKNPFDQFLLNISALHPIAAKLVDAYTSVFFKPSIVRKKCILLLAILESCPIGDEYFDVPESGSKIMLFIKMLWKAEGFFIALTVSIVLLMPLHFFFAMYSKLFHQ